MNEEEIKLKWKVFEKRKGHAHASRPLYFHSQKGKQVNHRIQGDCGRKYHVCDLRGGECTKQYQYSAVNPSISEPLPSNLTAHGHCKVRAKEC